MKFGKELLMQMKDNYFFEFTKEMDLQKFLPIKHAIIAFCTVLSYNKSVTSATTILIINPKYILEVLKFLQLSALFRMNCMTDLFCVDKPSLIHRFELNYCLLSTTYNERINIKIFINSSESLLSCSNIFAAANWLEREAWDL